MSGLVVNVARDRLRRNMRTQTTQVGHDPSRIAFGNQTVSPTHWSFKETHGFAPLPRNRFALIVCNRQMNEKISVDDRSVTLTTTTAKFNLAVSHIVCQQPFLSRFLAEKTHFSPESAMGRKATQANKNCRPTESELIAQRVGGAAIRPALAGCLAK